MEWRLPALLFALAAGVLPTCGLLHHGKVENLGSPISDVDGGQSLGAAPEDDILVPYQGPSSSFAKRSRAGTCMVSALRGCASCWLSPQGSPRLFLRETTEGLGARMQNIIYGMAMAARNGMNLGGVISMADFFGRYHRDVVHKADIVRAVSNTLGLTSPAELFTECPPPFAATFNSTKDLEGNRSNISDGTNVLLLGGPDNQLSQHLEKHFKHNMDELLTPKFLQALRNPTTNLSRWPTHLFKLPSQPVVAVHVRRGDVNLTDSMGRYNPRATPDLWYFRLIKRVRQVLPDADVHVFSSTERRHSSSDFNGYRRRGMAVHLDGDVMEAWAHFAKADVLITAKSSFSHVAALFNTKCVISQDWWYSGLPDWIRAGTPKLAKRPNRKLAPRVPPEYYEVTFDESKFKECLLRIGLGESIASPAEQEEVVSDQPQTGTAAIAPEARKPAAKLLHADAPAATVPGHQAQTAAGGALPESLACQRSHAAKWRHYGSQFLVESGGSQYGCGGCSAGCGSGFNLTEPPARCRLVPSQDQLKCKRIPAGTTLRAVFHGSAHVRANFNHVWRLLTRTYWPSPLPEELTLEPPVGQSRRWYESVKICEGKAEIQLLYHFKSRYNDSRADDDLLRSLEHYGMAHPDFFITETPARSMSRLVQNDAEFLQAATGFLEEEAYYSRFVKDHFGGAGTQTWWLVGSPDSQDQPDVWRAHTGQFQKRLQKLREGHPDWRVCTVRRDRIAPPPGVPGGMVCAHGCDGPVPMILGQIILEGWNDWFGRGGNHKALAAGTSVGPLAHAANPAAGTFARVPATKTLAAVANPSPQEFAQEGVNSTRSKLHGEKKSRKSRKRRRKIVPVPVIIPAAAR